MKIHTPSVLVLLLALGCADSKDGSSEVTDTGEPAITDYDDADGDGIIDGHDGTGDADDDGVPNYMDNESDGDGIAEKLEGGNYAISKQKITKKKKSIL